MKRILTLFVPALSLYGCSHNAPMATVDYVDIDRFMGDWYVVANIPTFLEEGAHNAVESYARNDDGTIATTFTFRAGGFDGKLKQYNPTGYVKDDKTNALWGMQFIWPIKADYRIVYLDNEYSKTIIGREARDYVWVMARDPQLSDDEYLEIVEFIGSIGYDTSKVNRVPHDWPDDIEKRTGENEPS
ncbi:MAG: lipocalin family protein [Thiotrichales bacterium]|nr:MAG: lipocalin family protein [Thiotrichales bacterium]